MGEGMALAEGLVLLGVESLSFQVDLTYLGTAKVQSHGLGGGRRGPFPTSHEPQRQGVERKLAKNTRCGAGSLSPSPRGGTHRTHKTCVVPAEAQGLQKAVPSINLEVTATAFCAKHLFIV